MVEYNRPDEGYGVRETETGIRCGNHPRGVKVRHADVESVKACYALTRALEAEQAAEQAAELAYERHLEDRGYWDARAQDDYERRTGVISFAEAYRQACPELFESET